MADKTFSVMVNNAGVLDYPSNFITANNLAAFGSDVVGTFKQIKFGSEDINPSTITVNSTENVAFGGYNTDLIISNNSYGECNLVLCANCGGGYNQNEFGIIRIWSEPAVMQCDIDLIAYKEGAGAGFINLKSFNTNIYCAEEFTVNASSASLPANTTIGGKTIASLAGTPSNMVTTDTEQTITGNKTFTGAVNLSDGMITTDPSVGDSNISGSSIEVNANSSVTIYGAEGLSISDSYNNSIGFNSTTGMSIMGLDYVGIHNTTSGNDSNLLLESGSAKLESTASYFLAYQTDATVWAGEQVFITAYNSEIGAINMSAPSYIDLKSNEVVIGKDDNSSIRLKGSIDTTYSSAVVTTIGTSETSAKLPTEGAIVKALKNVSGSTPDLSEYLKKSGDTTLTLGGSDPEEGDYEGFIRILGSFDPHIVNTKIDGNAKLELNSDVGGIIADGFYGLSISSYDSDSSTTQENFSVNVNGDVNNKVNGISGSYVDTTIPETPVVGHIATTGAIKTYVDNKVASGGSAPSNMVTTDTEQTITGEKTFTGNIYIEPANNGNYCYISAYNNLDITCDGTVSFSPGDNIILAPNPETGYIRMDSVMKLRVYNTSTKKWTTTYKYAYLAQDKNNQISIAISDTYPEILEDE